MGCKANSILSQIDTRLWVTYHDDEAVLDGELAVPCTRNPLQRG